MQFTRLFVVLSAALAGFSAIASAQTSPTSPLSLEDAQAMAQAAVEKCHAGGSGPKVTVVIVDSLGMPKYVYREDGAGPGGWLTSQLKAYTAVLERRPSGTNIPPGPLGHFTPTITPGITRTKGGVPVVINGIAIAGIGVSGSPDHMLDQACAAAGLEKVATKLGAKQMKDFPKPQKETEE